MKSVSFFINTHQTSTIVVCVCGESLNDLTQYARFITICVNDVGCRFQPNYLVVNDPPNHVTGDRFRFVENSRAEYLFTPLDLGVKHPNIVKFQLGTFGGTDFSNEICFKIRLIRRTYRIIWRFCVLNWNFHRKGLTGETETRWNALILIRAILIDAFVYISDSTGFRGSK